MMLLNQFPVMFRKGSFDSYVDRLLDEAVETVAEGARSWTPAYNLFEDQEGFTVQMALPGLEANQIKVEVVNNQLYIAGERPSDVTEHRTWLVRSLPEGMFNWSCHLPASVDANRSTASYTQGLLTIRFPKRDEAKPRQISITCQ